MHFISFINFFRIFIPAFVEGNEMINYSNGFIQQNLSSFVIKICNFIRYVHIHYHMAHGCCEKIAVEL